MVTILQVMLSHSYLAVQIEMSHPALPAHSGENNSAETQLEEMQSRPSDWRRAGGLEFVERSQSLGNMSNIFLTGERCVSKVVKF